MSKLDELVTVFRTIKSEKEWKLVLADLLTSSEVSTLLERWETVSLLLDGLPQREVQSQVGVSISKVTHASHILKKNGAGFRLIYERVKKKA